MASEHGALTCLVVQRRMPPEKLPLMSHHEEGHTPQPDPPSAQAFPTSNPLEDEKELRAFVGDEAGYYLGVWSKGGQVSFNWAAFLFSAPWLFYRKMYGIAVLFLAVGIALVAVLPELAVTFGLALLCGLFGNRLYCWQARRAVREACFKEPLEENRLKMLARRGGTSVVAVFLFLLVVLLGPLLTGQFE